MSAKTKRRRELIAELSRLSRNGWAHARPEDYQPLERELGEHQKPTTGETGKA